VFGSFFVFLKDFFVFQNAAEANLASFSCLYADSRAIIGP